MAEIHGNLVPRGVVIDVIRKSELVDIAAPPEADGGAVVSVTLARRGEADPTKANLCVFQFEDLVQRKLLHKLARDYSIPIQWFWNPSMAQKAAT